MRKRIFTHGYLFLTLLTLLSSGCKKNWDSEDHQIAIHRAADMYAGSEKLDPVVQTLVNSFKKQKEFNSHLVEFIERNGVPVWEKTIYATKSNAKATKLGGGKVAVNNKNIRTASEGASSQQAFYLIPLKSTSNNQISSYIAASKYDDSSFSYRLYNKDSLSRIVPSTDSARNQLMTSLAMFGVFEKSVNKKDSVDIEGALAGRFRNVDIKMGSDVKVAANSVKANYMQETGCEITIDIYLTYMYLPRVTSYIYEYEWRLVSVSIEITLTCWDYSESGGGGTGPGEPSSYDWWRYGTGWPWTNPLAYEMANQPWQPWWTSGGGGYRDPNALSYYDLELLDNLEEEEAQEEADAATDCYGTAALPGSVMLQPNAVLAHLIIQEDYIKWAGTGARAEYSIPNSSASGNRGKADIANITTKEIFEIKPGNLEAQGALEAQLYVDKANQYCLPGPWRLGDTYPSPRVLPNPTDNTTVIRVILPQNGVLTYGFMPRNVLPVPVAAPVSVFDAVRELMNRRRLNPNQDLRELVMMYVKELKRVSPGTLTTLKNDITNIAYGLLLAYTLEAIVTEGAALLADFEKVIVARYLLAIAPLL